MIANWLNTLLRMKVEKLVKSKFEKAYNFLDWEFLGTLLWRRKDLQQIENMREEMFKACRFSVKPKIKFVGSMTLRQGRSF